MNLEEVCKSAFIKKIFINWKMDLPSFRKNFYAKHVVSYGKYYFSVFEPPLKLSPSIDSFRPNFHYW